MLNLTLDLHFQNVEMKLIVALKMLKLTITKQVWKIVQIVRIARIS